MDEQKIAFIFRPAVKEESDLFYSQSDERNRELGAIGHVRIDFGSGGKEFWHTWWPKGPEALNNSAFKTELGQVVDLFRKGGGPLENLDSMRRFCCANGGEIDGGWQQNYGFITMTENYIFCLRCNPVMGDYQAYLNCYVRTACEKYLKEGQRWTTRNLAVM